MMVLVQYCSVVYQRGDKRFTLRRAMLTNALCGCMKRNPDTGHYIMHISTNARSVKRGKPFMGGISHQAD